MEPSQQPTPCHILDTDNISWWLPDDLDLHKPNCIHRPQPEEAPTVASEVATNNEQPKTWQEELHTLMATGGNTEAITAFVQTLLDHQQTYIQNKIAEKILINLFRED